MLQNSPFPNPTGGQSFAAGDIVADRYRLERVVGEGGMGIVWAATHLTTGRAVAIKVLKRNGPEDAARLLREARVAASLQHRNIIQVFDLWQLPNTGVLIMVMDLLRGESLAERLRRERVLGLTASAEILYAVGSALKSAHQQGFVHRDLKPDNIFLAQENDGLTVVKVLDFGLAREADPTSSTHVTHSGAVTGTPHYMAPEQIFGEKVLDRAVDVWALGVVWVECLSGQLLFDGDNFGQIFRKIALGERTPLEGLLAGFPAELVDLISRMLLRDPAKRPTDDEVLAGLRRHQLHRDFARQQPMGIAMTPFDPPLAPMETTVARSFSREPLPTVQHTNLATSLDRRKPVQSGKWVALAAAVLSASILIGATFAIRSWLTPRTDRAQQALLAPSAPASPSPAAAVADMPNTPAMAKPTALEVSRDALVDRPDAGPPARPTKASERPARPKPSDPKPKNYLNERF